MTEAEAWREIARRIVEGEWSRLELCYDAHKLYLQSQIDRPLSVKMRERLEQHIGRGLAYPYGTEPEARALAALWLALEAEEEAA
jgi:hypothetical protein